jgi:hypothetical protein
MEILGKISKILIITMEFLKIILQLLKK